eukprot:459620-Prorocentrum_lima.AAC.1
MTTQADGGRRKNTLFILTTCWLVIALQGSRANCKPLCASGRDSCARSVAGIAIHSMWAGFSARA